MTEKEARDVLIGVRGKLIGELESCQFCFGIKDFNQRCARCKTGITIASALEVALGLLDKKEGK